MAVVAVSVIVIGVAGAGAAGAASQTGVQSEHGSQSATTASLATDGLTVVVQKSEIFVITRIYDSRTTERTRRPT